MNCAEFAEQLGLRLAGEMGAVELAAFDTHAAECHGCGQLLESSIALDDQLREAVLAETPDAGPVVARVRVAMVREKTLLRARWLGIAAATVLAVGAAVAWMAARPAAGKVSVAAAKDHNVEVVHNSPRRWRLAIPAMQPLLEQYRVGWSDVQALLPVGFILERAKECRIDGQPTLHLVFTDGTRAVSVYVRGTDTEPVAAQTTIDGAEVAGFRRGRLAGLVVTAGAPGLCAEAVRRLAAL